MDYLIIFGSILMFAIQTVCLKEFNRTYMKNIISYFIFSFLYFITMIVIFLTTGGALNGFSYFTTILAITFGILFTVFILCLMKAMESGPLSYTSLFVSLSLLIPVAAGIIIWGEAVNILQALGLILLLVTFYIGSQSSRIDRRNMNPRWMIFTGIAFVCNGCLMTLLKWHQLLLPEKEIKEFLVLAFGTAAMMSLVLVLWNRQIKRQRISHFMSFRMAIIVTVTGTSTALGYLLMLRLASRIPSTIQFPMVNGGVVIASTVVSVLLFKEKISRLGVSGLLLGITALILLSTR